MPLLLPPTAGRWPKAADPPQAPPHPDHSSGCSVHGGDRRLLPPPSRAQHALGCKAEAGGWARTVDEAYQIKRGRRSTIMHACASLIVLLLLESMQARLVPRESNACKN